MIQNRRVLRICALLLALLLTFCGCAPQQPEPELPDAEEVESSQLALELQGQYAEVNPNVEYMQPEYNLPRNAVFDFTLGFDPVEAGFVYVTEIVSVYSDASLTREVSVSCKGEHNDDGTTSLTVKPGSGAQYALPSTYDKGGKTYRLGTPADEYYLYDKGDYADWGNCAQYYRVQWVDFETGEPLAKPRVTVFTIQHELSSPSAEFYVTPDGSAAFRWNAVEGAQRYYICRASYSGTRYSYTTVLDYTDKTYWEYDNGDIASVMNSPFRTDKDSEDYKLSPYYEPDKEKDAETATNYRYFIIAANEADCSAASNEISDDAIAGNLPYCNAWNTRQNDTAYDTRVDNISLLPAQMPVTMCDGSTKYFLLRYDIEYAHEGTTAVYETDDETGEIVPGSMEKYQHLSIPYTPEGTLLTGSAIVDEWDKATYRKEFEEVQKRQNSLRSNAGVMNITLEIDDSYGGKKGGDKNGLGALKPDDELRDKVAMTYPKKTKVFGSSALSAYMAINMLSGKEEFSLKDFPEASDRTVLVDAWNEAVYQNPLILGVSSASWDLGSQRMYIEYDDVDLLAKKQHRVQAEVQRVVEKVITPGMTDLEKEMALNQYLCDTAEYDYDALKNAEKHDYKGVDPEFNDSFTAYGVLLNKKGVCASYAAAFKLLAESAGLDCIVVTGYLNGGLSHAWNRVRIDGEWKTVDVTNNDNPELFNALFNLPDDAAELALSEDDKYMIDSALPRYTAQSNSAEYYRVCNKYYDTDEIVNALTEGLVKEKSVALRTDYELNDEEFRFVVRQVRKNLGGQKVGGYYWMGVIYLMKL